MTPPDTDELTLQVVSGDGQSGAAGTELPSPLVVKVTRPDGSPVKDQILNFRVVAGGGSVFAGVAITNNQGIGQERWTLGPEGEQRVEVRAVDTKTGEPLVFAVFTATIVCHDCWKTLKPMGIARASAAFAAVNGKLYVIGGDSLTQSGRVRSVEAYDPATDTWSFKASMANNRSALAAATINGLVYAVGGILEDTMGAVAITGRLEAYDPATNTWTVKAAMPTPRRFAGAVAINGLLYVIGGLHPGGDPTPAVEVYDPATDTWTQRTPMPFSGRFGMGVAVVGGTIFAIGGRIDPDAGPVRSVDAYDVATDTWSSRAPLPQSRVHLGAAAVNDIIYALGGTGPVELDEHDAYDVRTDAWTPRSRIPEGRLKLGVVALDGVVYAAGGETIGGSSRTLQMYRP